MAETKPVTIAGKIAAVLDQYTDRLIVVDRKKGTTPNYLQVADRLELLRSIDPGASITIIDKKIEPGFAFFHVRVALSDGTIGEAAGSETKDDFRDYVEKANTKAIGRALTVAGVGLQFAAFDDFAFEEAERRRPKDYTGVDTPPASAPQRTAPAAGAPAPGTPAPGAPVPIRGNAPAAPGGRSAPVAQNNGAWVPDGSPHPPTGGPRWLFNDANQRDWEEFYKTARAAGWQDPESEQVAYFLWPEQTDSWKAWQAKQLAVYVQTHTPGGEERPAASDY